MEHFNDIANFGVAGYVRLGNALMAIAVVIGLLHRLLSRLDMTGPLARWTVALWASMEGVYAALATQAQFQHVEFSEVHFAFSAHLLVTLWVIWRWPRLEVLSPQELRRRAALIEERGDS